MIVSLILFENEFLHIVSISFTALILNELIMVALEITTWYTSSVHLLLQPLLTYKKASVYGHFRSHDPIFLCCQYGLPSSLFRWAILTNFDSGPSITDNWKDLSFVVTLPFAWKVAVIVAISALPLYIIRAIKRKVAPAASSKLL